MPRGKRYATFADADDFAELLEAVRRREARVVVRTTNYPGTGTEHIAVRACEGGRWYRLASTQQHDFHALAVAIRPHLDGWNGPRLARFLDARHGVAPVRDLRQGDLFG